MENRYLEIKRRHQQEIDDFPMAFAFSREQFKEGMASLGLTPDDTDKIFKLGDTGGFYRRTDAPALRALFDRHEREMSGAIAADETGEGFVFEMFDYELANHEYCITGDVSDTLEALGLTREKVNTDPRLKHGLAKARNAQLASA